MNFKIVHKRMVEAIKISTNLSMSLALMVSSIVFAHFQAQAIPLRVLIFTKATGYKNVSKPNATAAIIKTAVKRNWTTQVDSGTTLFTTDGLAKFDVIVWNNTNVGSATQPILSTTERDAFVKFIEGGGGFVGIHGAANPASIEWPWFVDLVGCVETAPRFIENGLITVEKKYNDPSTINLPATFNWNDEYWTPNRKLDTIKYIPKSDSIEILLTVKSPNFPAGHPVSWRHTFHGGRSWFIAPGKDTASFSNPNIIEHLAGGIEWAGQGKSLGINRKSRFNSQNEILVKPFLKVSRNNQKMQLSTQSGFYQGLRIFDAKGTLMQSYTGEVNGFEWNANNQCEKMCLLEVFGSSKQTVQKILF